MSMFGRIHQGMTFLTSLRAQRAVLGTFMLALALPTGKTYEFFGTGAMAYSCALGGVVAIGLAIANPPLYDRREVFLGATLMFVFGIRFVVFAAGDVRGPSEWSWSGLYGLYLGSSPLWMHATLFFVGAVLVRRWIDARHKELTRR